MRFEDRFTVSLPMAQAWEVLLDVERMAPCMPGAELLEVVDGEYRGVVKVKLGAITTQYKGAVRFAEVDETGHRVVLRAEGRETRGQGNAAATVTASLEQTPDGATAVAIETDLSITGKVAQFGRGVLADVSSKLLGEFARCVEESLGDGGPPGAAQVVDAPPTTVTPSVSPAPGAGTAGDSAETGTNGAAATTVASAPPASTSAPAPPRRPRPVEPVDLLAMAGPSVAQRGLPAALVLVLVLLAVVKGRGTRVTLSLVGSALTAAIALAGRSD